MFGGGGGGQGIPCGSKYTPALILASQTHLSTSRNRWGTGGEWGGLLEMAQHFEGASGGDHDNADFGSFANRCTTSTVNL